MKAPVTGGVRNTITEEKVQEMHDLNGQGLTNDDTSRRVGLSPTRIKKHNRRVAPGKARAPGIAAAARAMNVAEVPSRAPARAR